jgi:hypothetical protein
MRQNIKDQEFYKRSIAELEFIESRSKQWLRDEQIPKERISIVLDSFRAYRLKRTKLKFTFGESIEDVKKEFQTMLDYVNDSWVGLGTLKLSADKSLKQYILSAYDEMLWMLSLGYLLDISIQEFKKLVVLIDKDEVEDFLFEFIIKAKISDRKPIARESYQEVFRVPNVFEKLRQAIIEPEKTKAEKLVHDFITKDWYKKHKDAGWHNSHKSVHDVYSGYWSFETAAVVKIMRLNDSSFRNSPYYPKDLL